MPYTDTLTHKHTHTFTFFLFLTLTLFISLFFYMEPRCRRVSQRGRQSERLPLLLALSTSIAPVPYFLLPLLFFPHSFMKGNISGDSLLKWWWIGSSVTFSSNLVYAVFLVFHASLTQLYTQEKRAKKRTHNILQPGTQQLCVPPFSFVVNLRCSSSVFF